MKPERWRELEELYRAAQGLSAAERNRLLAQADPELRSAVAAILAGETPVGAAIAGLLSRPLRAEL